MQNLKNFCRRHRKLFIIPVIIIIVLLTARVLYLYYSLRPNTVQLTNIKFNLQRKWIVYINEHLENDKLMMFGNKTIIFDFFETQRPQRRNDRLIKQLIASNEAFYETIAIGNIQVQALKRMEKSSLNDKGKEEVYEFAIGPYVSASIHIQVDEKLKHNEDAAKDFLANNVTISNK